MPFRIRRTRKRNVSFPPPLFPPPRLPNQTTPMTSGSSVRRSTSTTSNKARNRLKPKEDQNGNSASILTKLMRTPTPTPPPFRFVCSLHYRRLPRWPGLQRRRHSPEPVGPDERRRRHRPPPRRARPWARAPAAGGGGPLAAGKTCLFDWPAGSCIWFVSVCFLFVLDSSVSGGIA